MKNNNIPKNWREVKLGEVCETNKNSYLSSDKWLFVNYLDTGNITQNKIDEIQYIDLKLEKLPSRAKRKALNGSILYSTVRPNQLHYGIIKNQPDNFLVSTGFAVLDVKESIANTLFIYYILTQKENTEKLHSIAEQSVSTYPSIKPSDIENLEFLLPPLEEQERIAGILGALDDKIELNNKINQNLESQAQALFDSVYEVSQKKETFTSLIKVLGGGTPKTDNPDFWNGHIPFFTPKDVAYPYVFHTEKSITESGLEKCNSQLYPKNTTFVTARGTVGKLSLAGCAMAMNQSCYALMSDTIDPILVYFYTLKTIASLKHKAAGAVFDAITTKDFSSEQIFLISKENSKKILLIIKPIMDKIHSNFLENTRLAEIRDALLPKLLSGEIKT